MKYLLGNNSKQYVNSPIAKLTLGKERTLSKDALNVCATEKPNQRHWNYKRAVSWAIPISGEVWGDYSNAGNWSLAGRAVGCVQLLCYIVSVFSHMGSSLTEASPNLGFTSLPWSLPVFTVIPACLLPRRKWHKKISAIHPNMSHPLPSELKHFHSGKPRMTLPWDWQSSQTILSYQLLCVSSGSTGKNFWSPKAYFSPTKSVILGPTDIPL